MTASPIDTKGFRYLRCGSCGSGRLHPLPEQAASEYYSDEYFTGNRVGGYANYDADAANHARNARARLDRVAAHTSPGDQRLIDVGCASGYVLDDAARRGWRPTGVDVSAWARQQSSAKGHTTFATIGEAVSASPPTIVTFFQVLEHMAEARASLAEAAGALQPGGLLAIESWDVDSRAARMFGGRWQQLSPPSVIHLFTKRGLGEMLHQHGLDVVVSAATSKRVSVELVAGVVSQRSSALAGPLRKLTASRLGRLGVPYRLGDLITVIARKR
jgi:SAM-dependent methyltransferase